jgi:hypothetical protein
MIAHPDCDLRLYKQLRDSVTTEPINKLLGNCPQIIVSTIKA